MSIGLQFNEHFSTDVELQFVANGQSYELAKIGHREIHFKYPIDISACEGTIILKIDGRPQTWKVRLNEDVVPFSEGIPFTDIEQ